MIHVAVAKNLCWGFGEFAGVYDGSVVVFIGVEGDAEGGEGLEGAEVRLKACWEGKGAGHGFEGGQGVFQVAVDAFCSADETRCGGADTPGVGCLGGGGQDVWMVGEAEVVVACEVDGWGSVGPGALSRG